MLHKIAGYAEYSIIYLGLTKYQACGNYMKENEANDSGIISVGLFQNVTILPNVRQLILYGLNNLPHHEEN